MICRVLNYFSHAIPPLIIYDNLKCSWDICLIPDVAVLDGQLAHGPNMMGATSPRPLLAVLDGRLAHGPNVMWSRRLDLCGRPRRPLAHGPRVTWLNADLMSFGRLGRPTGTRTEGDAYCTPIRRRWPSRTADWHKARITELHAIQDICRPSKTASWQAMPRSCDRILADTDGRLGRPRADAMHVT
ncbi:hypothetical protein M404DRAFT_36274 [Pisolithus tinctorius Marx 270]|uniref:Uncharacterized protein n=1 Tax=Pisolithus tinctorius Marx 270 TaxID=870435 RepID=A0A0C3NCD1_PISTI|nr:hypothetical protein M404DRAFT_36274 [Pisolithus tinctorius Marx 270]